jgi:FkbM family methyltransferase
MHDFLLKNRSDQLQSSLIKSILRATVPRPVRNWLRSPSRSVEWLWDSSIFSLGSTKTLELSPECRLICHPHAYRVIYSAQIQDAEQREEFENFLSHCGERMFLFDIGAHFGVFSLAAGHFGGRAVAVDPSPISAKMIATEAVLNGLTERIQILQSAVSDHDRVMNLLSSGVFTAGYFKVVKGRSKRELTETPATTIDEMALQFGVPTHIKIDVEGHEAAVLRGARGLLRKSSPILFLELHNEMVASEGGDPSAALAELESLGYSCFGFDGERLSYKAILSHSLIRITARCGVST